MKLNLSTLLLILGGLGVFAPDVAAVATWLASMHIAWLVLPVKILGFTAGVFAAAPLIVPRLRAFLALLGLATPPGALAPWVPGNPGEPNVIPLLDGSSVVQVSPPSPSTTGAPPSLVSVAVNPKQVTATPIITQPMPPKPAA